MKVQWYLYDRATDDLDQLFGKGNESEMLRLETEELSHMIL